MTQSRFPAPVRSFVLAHQHEGFVRVSFLLEPLQAQVGDDIRSVSGVLDLLAVLFHKKKRVVIGTLTVENFITVESRRVGFQVPLADQGGLVSCLAEELGEGHLRTVEGVPVGHLSIVEGMATGK